MNNPTEKSLEAECREAFEKWSESVKDFGHTVQPNSATARQRKLGWDAAWNIRKGEAARLKAMVDKPEVVDRVALVMGRVIAQAEVQPVKAWEKAAKAVLAELVKMMEE